MIARVIGGVLSVIAGIAIALIGMYLVGYTAAISAPERFFDWFNENLDVHVALFLWSLIVVQLPAVGIPAAIISYWTVRLTSLSGFINCVLIIATVFTFGYVIYPLVVSGVEISLAHTSWWQHAHVPAVILSVALGGLLGSRR